jgi:hypothetical protein
MAAPPGGPGNSLGSLTQHTGTIRVSPAQSVPEREPLSMETAVVKYLRPRDALAIFHRVESSSTTTP